MSASSLVLALGAVENVVQLINFGAQLCCRIKEYSVTAGAPEKLVAQANCLSDLLKVLGDLPEAEQETLERSLISRCAETAKELSGLLESLIDRDRHGKSKWRYVWKACKSLHSEKKVESLQRALESLLGPLSLHLQAKTAQRTLTIKRQTEEILLQNAETIAIVPISRNRGFVGREGLLHRLYEQLSPKSCGQPKAALYGLGGVGKSQIALEYAYRFLQRTPKCSVFWVFATNTTRFEESYRRIASEYEIPGREDLKGDLMQLVRNWMESKYKGNWLMIVDNVDDVSVFFGENNSFGKSLSEYVPQSPRGAILYTTRDRRIGVNLAPPRGLISVPRMSSIEARDLLGEKVMCKSTKRERSELLEELDYLPLAISQAAAFMAGMGLTIPQYLAHYRHSHSAKIRLLGYKFAEHGREERPMESVLTTWMISFNYIQKENPRAADLLALMSFLDRQGIPKSLLVGKEEDPLNFSKAIGTLDAFSLIATNDQRDNYRMHSLVQLATRVWLTENEYNKGAKQASLALDLVARHFPNGGYEHWATCEEYLSHAKAVLDSCCEEYSNINNEARATILLNASCYFRSRGEFETAEEMAKRSVHLRQRILGDAHPDTLDSISNLASVLHDQGNYKEAEEGNRQALHWRKDELGKEALINSSNLASALQAQGRYKEAEDINRDALEGHGKLLGSRHPDTLASLNNLALVLQQQGKFEEAEEMHRRALEGSEKVLGTQHPDTLISLHNLAEVLRDQAQYGEAEKMHRRALEGGENVLGKEHPFTLTSLHNLAEVLRYQGKYDKAEEIHLRALKGSEKVLGGMHPYTLTSLHNLAELLRCKGRYGEAENIHRQALIRREKVLGEEHIDTLTSVGCLALVLQGQGKYREAERENRRALKGYERALGKDHLNTLTCLNNLALVLRHCCQYEEAEEMNRRALYGYERVLGKDHPDTLTSVYNLALVLRHCHKYEEAETESSSTERDREGGEEAPQNADQPKQPGIDV